MAKELEIKITTKYADAEKGFNKVTGSVQKYRNELLKASSQGKVTDETINNYVNALNKQLAVEDQTKEGMAALTAQAKLLRKEMTEIGVAFGEDGSVFKGLQQALDQVNSEIASLPANTKKASAGMGDLEKSSEGASMKLLSVAKNILKFQLLMGPITAAVRGFKNTISDSLNVAAEAEQRYNKLATVFDGLSTSAKNAATAIAAELGVATSTAASALSTVGDLLQAQGMGTSASLSTSSTWAKQFQDIIAFKDINMSLEEFAQNFMSGAAGNLRNFRTFGSIVKESAVNAELAKKGMDKLTGSQLELAKMTTRAELALKQQANAMGATKREWDTMLSVNRRLSESWKEYKENLGDTLNSVLLPMKSVWGAMLDQINKANKAQKEFNAGNRNIRVYDIYNNGEDSASFQSNLSAAYNQYRSNMSNAGQTIDGVIMGSELDAFNTVIKTVDSIIVKFGATVATVQQVMGDKLTPEMYKELRALEKIRVEENKRLEAIETRRGNIGASTDTYEAFTETLKAITGAGGIRTPDWASVAGQYAYTEGGDRVYANNVAASMMKAVSDALESINNSDLAEAFGDVISGALDELDEAGLREAQVESLRKLFEASWNQFAEGGFTDEEKSKLEEIRKSYKQATDALDAYNKKIQIQAALLSANSSIASVLSNTSRLKYENGLTGPQSSKDLDMALNWDIPLLIQDFAKSLRDVGTAEDDIRWKTESYRKALIDEANLKHELAKQAEEDAETQKRLEEQRKALESLRDQANPFKGVMDAYNTGRTALEGANFSAFGKQYELTALGAGIIGILTDILAQTQAFQKLTSIVTDHIVPVLDAFLEPILPVIDVIGDLMQSLVQGILVPLFPIIVEICAIITLIVGTIKNVANLIVDTFKKVIGSLGYNIMRALDKIIIGDQSHWYQGTWMDSWSNIDPLGNFKSSQEKLLEEVARIRGLTFDIKENTDDKDILATLKELYAANIISEDQFYAGARVMQKDMVFDPVSPSSDHYITYGSITINVNGGDIEETKRVIAEIFNENGISYNMALGRA